MFCLNTQEAELRKNWEEARAEIDELHKKLADPNIVQHMIEVYKNDIKLISGRVVTYENKLNYYRRKAEKSKQNSITFKIIVPSLFIFF